MYSPLSSVKPVAGLPGSRSSGERGTGAKMRWAWATAFPLHVTLPRTVAMAGPPQPLDPIRTATQTQTADREHARMGNSVVLLSSGFFSVREEIRNTKSEIRNKFEI